VQSEEGVGSTFFVELPLIFEEITTYHFNEQLRDKSILITIANEALLENVKSCLQDYGTHYMVVREIGDIKRIDASLWDAYLLDFQLPNSKDFLDGFNDIMERNKKFKIIGLFNYLQHEMAEEIKKQSNVEIVYKPILIRQLHDALTDVFKITKNISESEETIRFSKIAEKINKNIKILVAEDNIVNQKVIKGYFEKLGLKSIRIVENGLEALEAIQDTQFDIVFMDIQMPVMDGLITTMTIRKNEKETHTHLPIVALTAHSFIGEKQRCFDAGVDDYLGKPIQIDRLVICLEKWTANNKITSSEIELVSSESVAIVSEDITNDKVEIDFDFFTHTKEALGKSFLDVISSFITDSLEKIDLIEKAIRDDDKNAIRFCAHQLKSSSGSLGVKRLSEISKKLETAAKDPIYPKENIKIIFKALIAEFAKAKDFLEDEV